ncbi:hypothetical protein [Halovenus salina]|uniref:Haloacid dehalogenase-like hydrolase n=1 Tax=Halovenus salina TaxID=1510225 RepID=A0ABD5VV55_9EURY
MTDSVDALVFDIDGTICEYERTTADLLPLAFERAGVDQFFTATEYISRYEEFLESSDSVLTTASTALSTSPARKTVT